jgi:hypothetical protein
VRREVTSKCTVHRVTVGRQCTINRRAEWRPFGSLATWRTRTMVGHTWPCATAQSPQQPRFDAHSVAAPSGSPLWPAGSSCRAWLALTRVPHDDLGRSGLGWSGFALTGATLVVVGVMPPAPCARLGYAQSSRNWLPHPCCEPLQLTRRESAAARERTATLS